METGRLSFSKVFHTAHKSLKITGIGKGIPIFLHLTEIGAWKLLLFLKLPQLFFFIVVLPKSASYRLMWKYDRSSLKDLQQYFLCYMNMFLDATDCAIHLSNLVLKTKIRGQLLIVFSSLELLMDPNWHLSPLADLISHPMSREACQTLVFRFYKALNSCRN